MKQDMYTYVRSDADVARETEDFKESAHGKRLAANGLTPLEAATAYAWNLGASTMRTRLVALLTREIDELRQEGDESGAEILIYVREKMEATHASK